MHAPAQNPRVHRLSRDAFPFRRPSPARLSGAGDSADPAVPFGRPAGVQLVTVGTVLFLFFCFFISIFPAGDPSLARSLSLSLALSLWCIEMTNALTICRYRRAPRRESSRGMVRQSGWGWKLIRLRIISSFFQGNFLRILRLLLLFLFVYRYLVLLFFNPLILVI